MHIEKNNKAKSFCLFSILCAGAVAAAVPVLLGPDNFIPDDAYFYLQLAYNFARSGWFHFHDLSGTNGFQPLWQWALAATYSIGKFSRESGAHITILLDFVLMIATTAVWTNTFRPLTRHYSSINAMIVVAVCVAGMYASEAHLNALVLACLVAFFTRCPSTNRAFIPVGAILVAASMLARLDNVFVLFSTFSGLLLYALQRKEYQRAAALCCTIALSVVLFTPYLIDNYLSFGHMLPISGAIKSRFPHGAINLETITPLMAACGVISGIGIAVSLRMRPISPLSLIPLLFGVGELLQLGYLVFFTSGTAWRWYFMPTYLNGGVIAAVVVKAILDKFEVTKKPLVHAGALAMLILATVALLNARNWYRFYHPMSVQDNPFVLHRPTGVERWEVALSNKMNEFDELTNARIMVFDMPGYLAYHTQSQIVPADGLMNAYGYSDEILQKGIEPWLRAHNVNYYAGPIGVSYSGFMMKGDPKDPKPSEIPDPNLIDATGRQPIVVYAPLTNTIAGTIVIDTSHPLALVPASYDRTFGVFRIVRSAN